MQPIVFLFILFLGFFVYAVISNEKFYKDLPEKESQVAKESGFEAFSATIDFSGYKRSTKQGIVYSIDESHKLFSYMRSSP